MNEPISEVTQPETASAPLAEKPVMQSDMRLRGLTAAENADEMKHDRPSKSSGTTPFGWLGKMFRGE